MNKIKILLFIFLFITFFSFAERQSDLIVLEKEKIKGNTWDKETIPPLVEYNPEKGFIEVVKGSEGINDIYLQKEGNEYSFDKICVFRDISNRYYLPTIENGFYYLIILKDDYIYKGLICINY